MLPSVHVYKITDKHVYFMPGQAAAEILVKCGQLREGGHHSRRPVWPYQEDRQVCNMHKL